MNSASVAVSMRSATYGVNRIGERYSTWRSTTTYRLDRYWPRRLSTSLEKTRWDVEDPISIPTVVSWNESGLSNVGCDSVPSTTSPWSWYVILRRVVGPGALEPSWRMASHVHLDAVLGALG